MMNRAKLEKSEVIFLIIFSGFTVAFACAFLIAIENKIYRTFLQRFVRRGTKRHRLIRATN